MFGDETLVAAGELARAAVEEHGRDNQRATGLGAGQQALANAVGGHAGVDEVAAGKDLLPAAELLNHADQFRCGVDRVVGNQMQQR